MKQLGIRKLDTETKLSVLLAYLYEDAKRRKETSRKKELKKNLSINPIETYSLV